MLFFFLKPIDQVQAVTFKLNNDYYNLEKNYSNFEFEGKFTQITLEFEQNRNSLFELLDRSSQTNLESIKPKLINILLTSIKELHFEKFNNNLSQANVRILEQSEFGDVYKDVYDFEVDLVPKPEKTVARKNLDINLTKQKNPNYVASSYYNQTAIKSLPILPADNNWTNVSSFAINPNNNSQIQFNSKNFQSNRFGQNLLINPHKIVEISDQAVFAATIPKLYQPSSLVNDNQPESLKKIERSLQQQQKELAKQQDRMLKQMQQNQARLKKEAQRQQNELAKKREQELKRIKKMQDARQKNLQKQIANQQKNYYR